MPSAVILRPTPEQALLLAHFAYAYRRICGETPLGSRLSPLAEWKLFELGLVWLRGVPPQVIKAAISEKRDGGARPEGPYFRFVSRAGASISKQREKRRGPVTKRWLVLPELGWVVMDGKLPRQRILIVTIWRDPVRPGRAVPSMPSPPAFETAAANSGGDAAPMPVSWIGTVQPTSSINRVGIIA